MEKIERLSKILDIANEDIVSSEQLTEVVGVIVKAIKSTQDRLQANLQTTDGALRSQINNALERISSVKDELEKSKVSKIDFSKLISELKNEIKDLDSKIPLLDLTELENKIDSIVIPDIHEIENNLPSLGERIRDGLELLQGEERLDASAIKNLPEAVSKEVRVVGSTGIKEVIAGSGIAIDNSNLGFPKISAVGGAGTGDVVGPDLAVDSNFASFDTTTGKLIKDSGSKASDFATAGHNHTGVYQPVMGADDNYVTDAEKIVIGNTSGTNSGDNATNSQYSGLATSKQDTLVSGTNIKTINSTSLLGSGNIDIAGGSDEKVKYDSSDPTAGYVADKIVAGTGISVAEGTGPTENKLVITNSNPTPYTLPTAAGDTLGGVKVGTRLSITDGVLSADATDLSGLVPNTTTVNSKALSSNITLTQDDVGDGTTNKQYSATEKSKLAGIAEGAEVNVNADWNSATGDSQILNKPTLGDSASKNVGTTTGTVAAGDHNHTGTYKAVGADETANVSAASDSSAGKVELATVAETSAGTDTGRAITPDGLAGSIFGKKGMEVLAVDIATDVSAADGKAYLVIPEQFNGMNLVRAAAKVITAGTTNATTIDIYNVTDSQDMLSSAISIASGSTAVATGTINTSYDDVATDDVLRIDVTTASTTNAKGLIVILEFQLP